MNRLRQARQYIGLTQGDVASLLYSSMTVSNMVEALETGHAQPTDKQWERLSRLYRRPVAWLKGEPAPPVQISGELHDLMEGLSDQDRSEIVAFAEFLQHGAPAPAPDQGER